MNYQNILTALASSILLAACGGGSGGATTGSSNPTTYVAAAAPGELVTYSVDPAALTYSYTITESQYGLTNATGSGSLTALGNNVYSLSNIPGSRIAVLPNGLLLGAIRHNFGAGTQTVPVLGLSNPITGLSTLAGTYNYISRGCVSGSCESNYGTLRIQSAGTWDYCVRGNLTAGTPACAYTGSGNLVSLGSGKYAAYDGGTLVGTAIAMSSGGQNVLIVDLKDARTSAGSLGKGIVVASTQTPIVAAQTNGSWVATGSNGSYATFNTSGANISYTSLNGASYTASSSYTPESPWTGMGTSAASLPVMLAGYGVYLVAGPSGYIEIGVKYK